MVRSLGKQLLVAIGLLLTVARSTSAAGRIASHQPDASTLIEQISDRYAAASYYYVEMVSEDDMKRELFHTWSKSLTTVAYAPGNRYRFEVRDEDVWVVQISDGKTEWTYRPATGEYLQQPTPASGPSEMNSAFTREESELSDAHSALRDLASSFEDLHSARYLPDQVLTIDHKRISCEVIYAKYPHRAGWPAGATSHVTLWIDKETHVVRKVRSILEGSLIRGGPQEHDVRTETELYVTTKFDPTSAPDAFFEFTPPRTAKLVTRFAFPQATESQASSLIGRPAPDVNLKSDNGKTVSLKSFQGKPLMVEFWATWCGPCRELMPALEKLYRENAAKGLAMISIDEDGKPKRATDFLAKQNAPWGNFHDPDGEVSEAFSGSGIPQVVLIDATGKIVFSCSGCEESEIRVAIAKLGPEFSPVNP
jgi:thiol-disulfide isomerase/thioredoxin